MLKTKRQFTLEEERFFLAISNLLYFNLIFWKDELTIPDSRTDLPGYWRGKQVISLEQRMMILDRSPRKQICTSRKIWKTGMLESEYFHRPLMHLTAGKEAAGMFHVPREHHRDPVIGRVKTRAARIPLFNMMKERFNEGRQEFRFHGDWTWFNRIEGHAARAGVSMVGLRCVVMMGDEGAYGNDAAHSERQNTALPGADWIWTGVPNGIRGTQFHAVSEKIRKSSWSVHRYDMRANPIYQSLKAWNEVIEQHGSIHSHSYITQVLGEWGTENIATFAVIPTSGNFEFARMELNASNYDGGRLDPRLELSALMNIKIPPENTSFIVGADIGLSPSPTEISVAVLDQELWWKIAHVTLRGMHSINQARSIDAICCTVLPSRPRRVVLDAHVMGSGVLHALHYAEGFDNDYYREFAIDAGFGSVMPDKNITVHKKCGQRVREGSEREWFCDTCQVLVWSRDDLRPASVQTKQVLMARLKEFLAFGQEFLNMQGRGGDYVTSNTLTKEESLSAGVAEGFR